MWSVIEKEQHARARGHRTSSDAEATSPPQHPLASNRTLSACRQMVVSWNPLPRAHFALQQQQTASRTQRLTCVADFNPSVPSRLLLSFPSRPLPFPSLPVLPTQWFGVVRWIHNRAVDALRVDPTASATSLRAAVAESESEHEWAAAVPLAIRDATVAQLVGALHLAQRSAEVAAAATGEAVVVEPIGTAAQNKALKYRTRKDRLEQIVLRADG